MREIIAKSVLNKKKVRDSWFLDEYTLNPYEGCSFNCLYCYIRGSKYGENMTEALSVKANVLEVLDRQLAFRARKNQYGIIALASATDPYMHVEERQRKTEGCLQLILKHRFPVLIITKSVMVLRDIGLLKEIDKNAILPDDLRSSLVHGAIVSFSFSTLDDKVASLLEPGAPPPSHRLQTMKRCKNAGLMVGVNCVPTLPYLSDTEDRLEEMVIAAKENGADYILIGGLTLFGDKRADSKTLYYKFLTQKYPQLVPSYEKLYRHFFMPSKAYLKTLDERADRLCVKHGIRRGLLRT
ncbi:MAG TPA: radical SAM protein [Cyclobacteriaceae bacterium]|nr:radical SAM protein [Cyclobacteriaceae bacterium]